MRQLRDVAGIVAMRGDALDLDYVERWVGALVLEAEWARVRTGDVTGSIARIGAERGRERVP